MDKVKLIVFDTRKHTYNELLLTLNISEEEAKALKKYRALDTRKEKLVSLYFKKKYVGEYSYNEYDKPISPNAFFNISHSKGVVVLALNKEVELGVDIEILRAKDDDLIKYICSEEEYKFVKNEIDFLSVWTNKESLVKCLGTGIKKNVKTIPALPLCGKKEYDGQSFYSKIIRHNDAIISLTVKGNEDFDFEFYPLSKLS